MQSEAPNDASNIDTEKSEVSSASFSSEPLESPQTVETAPVSFGDLLNTQSSAPPQPASDNPQTTQPSPSALQSPSQPVSFGDLIKDIKLEEGVSLPPLPQPSESPSPSQSNSSPNLNDLNNLPAQAGPSDLTNLPTPPLPQSTQLDQSIQSPQITSQQQASAPAEIPIVDQDEVEGQVTERLKQKEQQIRDRGREVKAQKRENRFKKILSLAASKSYFTNADIRDLLHISQSAATNYLSELVGKGSLKREGKSKYIRYSFP